MSAKVIADAIHSLPDEKRRAVLLYYFFDMNDAEIAELYQIPRSTVQYRRTGSFELLKRYLEEHAYDYPDRSTDDERGLLPYPVIIATTKGEPQAMNIVCQHYVGYIAHLSMRKLRDERGNTYYGIDEDIRDRLRSKLMQAVLIFKI